MSQVSLQQDAVLAEMVRRLVDAYRPVLIYLFGSRVTGEDKPDSDYDLLVVVERSDLPLHKRAQQAFGLLCGVGAAKDVLVLTEDEFDRKRDVVASLPATVIREGRVLYAK